MCCATGDTVEKRGKEGRGKEGKANSHEGCPGKGGGMLHMLEMWLRGSVSQVGCS